MMTFTRAQRLAIAARAVATGGALTILPQDALKAACGPWSMLVTVLAGHFVSRSRTGIQVAIGAGFLVVAISASWGAGYTSVGNQSQVAKTKIKAAA
jgi:hypothetical protein